MLIEAYILCWNEEKILPFTLEHYSSFCDRILLLDNHSTDRSLEIAEQFPKVQVIQWNAREGENIYDERSNVVMKNWAYEQHGVGADWVCVVDCDELVYHPNIREKLEEYMYAGITLPRTAGYEMISDAFPVLGTPLTEQITSGIFDQGMCKRLVFDPRIGLKYACGSHYSSSEVAFATVDGEGEPPPYHSTLTPKESEDVEIKVLHYKDLSAPYKIERLKMLSARMSEWCLETETSGHWLQTEEQILSYFKERLPLAEDVI